MTVSPSMRLMLAQWLRLDTKPHAVVATALPLLAGGPRRLAHGVFGALVRRGAAAVVMGCTEIPLALDADRAGCPVVDATAALARRAVQWSTAQRGSADAALPEPA